MSIHIFKTIPEIIGATADHVVNVAKNAIATRGEMNFVLSGGKSPEQLYTLLASPAYKNKIEWTRVNFFFGDERNVPANDPQNNSNMARKAMFEPLNISPSKIFAVNTSLQPEEAAKEYATRINKHFNEQEVKFDLILLGMGDDGHTASLFPGTTVLISKLATAESVFLKALNVFRITMTAPLINQARNIAFLIYGPSKANAIHEVLEGKRDFDKYPSQLIKPSMGSIQWFLDEDAAALLKSKK
jgi:6-phosphogluconolactonase